MGKQTISIIIQGQEKNKFFIRFADFIRELNCFLQILNETDKQICSKKEPINDYRIVDLSHSSPATIVIEAVPKKPNIDKSDEIFNGLFNIFSTIQEGTLFSQGINTNILTNIRDMSSLVGKTISKLEIETDGKSFNLNSPLKVQIDKILQEEESYPGFIRGMLEAINIHKDANVFRLYPDIGPQKITCHFPSDLLSQAIAGIGKFVETKGVLKYLKSSPYPYHITVHEVVVFPDEIELPKFDELRGVCKEATGELLSEDFVRKLRNASS